MPAVLVLDERDALALDRMRHDHRRTVGVAQRLLEGMVDLFQVVTVDLDRIPAERPGARRVGFDIPAQHRLAALAEPIDVDDRGQVVQLVVRGVVERLPHRALGHLAVAQQDPHVVGQLVQILAGQADADADRQALAERTGGHVDPRDQRRRMALQPTAELAEGQQLVVGHRPRGLVERVEQRRRVPFGEDQVVVERVVRLIEVVGEVFGEQHRHQVGGGHRGGGVPRAGGGAGADAVDAQLLRHRGPEVSAGQWSGLDGHRQSSFN